MEPMTSVTPLAAGRYQPGSAPDEHNQLWSLRKVCEILGGVSDDTFHRLVKRKEFRKVKQGRSTYALAREVRAYLDRITVR